MASIKTTPCKGCGKPIVWAVDENGKRIPCDPKPPVYVVAADVRGAHCKRFPDAMVSHFATCTHASEFSKSSKGKRTVADEVDAGMQAEREAADRIAKQPREDDTW